MIIAAEARTLVGPRELPVSAISPWTSIPVSTTRTRIRGRDARDAAPMLQGAQRGK